MNSATYKNFLPRNGSLTPFFILFIGKTNPVLVTIYDFRVQIIIIFLFKLLLFLWNHQDTKNTML